MRLAGMIAGLRKFLTKKGETMCRLQLKDDKGDMPVVVFSSVFAPFQGKLQNDQIAQVECRQERARVIGGFGRFHFRS